jgi:hypothetical protein
MSAYRLLRNNKESGPFSLEEITAIGFKPYDLIWIDNKSAAWRYPYEIPELKPFTNFTEEQPYDRFYKKASDTAETKQETMQEVITATETLTETITEKKIEQIPSRKVYVSLPANSSLPVNKEKPVAVPALKPVPGVKTTLPSYTEQEKEIVQEYKQPAQAAVLTEKYSQPLDEIKKMYVDKLLNNKRSKNSFADKKKYMQIAAIVVVLLGLGIFIGSGFNKSRNKKTAVTSSNNKQTTTPPATDKTNLLSNPVVPVKENLPTEEENNTNTDANEPDQGTAATQQIEEPVTTTAKTLKKEKQLPVTNKSTEKIQEPQPSEIDPVTGERKKTARTEDAVPPKPKEDIWKMVSVRSNDYKRGSFGGISNLHLTVNNNSGYILDEVLIEIQYLKPSLEPLKKEIIRFSYVAPNGTMTIKVPDSKRGIKISYSITGINSRQYQAAYAGL